MRLSEQIIGDYVAQDDRTTAVDQFLNAHDAQRLLRNWNCMLARRLRQPALLYVPGLGTGAAGELIDLYGIEPVRSSSLVGSHFLGPWLLPVPRHCTTMTLHIRASNVEASHNVTFYPARIGAPGHIKGVYDEDYRIEVAGTSVADYTCKVETSLKAREDGVGALLVGYTSAIDTSEGIKQTVNVLQAGPDWLIVDAMPTLASGSGKVLTFATDAGIGRYVATSVYAVEIDAATAYLVTVNRPFAKIPTTADTLDLYDLGTARIRSLSVWPDRVTEFAGAVEL